MRILVTSDLHLSERIWKHRPIVGDSYYAWRQICWLARTVDAVILAGDVLDKQTNSPRTVSQLHQGVSFIQNTPIYFVQGQHDFDPDVPWPKTAEADNSSVHWLKPENLVDLGGMSMVGTDFLHEEDCQEFLKQAIGVDILVMHQVWKDFMGEVGRPQACFDDVPSNVKLLITGDYHDTIQLQHKNMVVLSPGSTHLRSLNEPEDKNVFIITIENELKNVEIVPLKSRRKLVLNVAEKDTVTAVKQLEAFLEQAAAYAATNELPGEIAMPIVSVVHTKGQDSLTQYLQQEFSAKAYLFFKMVGTDGQEELSLDDKDEVQRVTLESRLNAFLAPGTPEESLALQLLTPGSPLPVLEAFMLESE